MAQIKGQTGNPNGRPKGSPNKVTADLRQLLTGFVKDNYEQFTKNFDSLTPEQYCTLYLKLLMLLVPKPEEGKEITGGYVVHVVDANDNTIADIKSENMN
jgi:hypothetical protein